MTKFLKREKINYLKGTKTYLDNLSYDNISCNNISNNNINTTLTNISNQLKNIAVVDKNKEFKLLNSSFRAYNKNPRNNIFSNNINLINSSLNLENNQNQNFFDLTSEMMNQKFQNLQKTKVFNFFILKSENNENLNLDEIKNENNELRENVKFLLKQIKKYQKSGLTIEDTNANLNRQQEIQNLEKEINDLKQEINKYKNKIISLNNSNRELVKENDELKNFININLKKINAQKEKEYKIMNNNNNSGKSKEFNGLTGGFDQYYDIGGFEDKNIEYKNLKTVFNNNTIKMKNINNKENYDYNNNNSKLSEELFADVNNEIRTIKNNNKNNYLYIREYSNHIGRIGKQRNNYSEGKLYCRKNIGKRNLSFNEDHFKKNINIKINTNNNNNYTYSKSCLRNNISFKNDKRY